MTWRCLSISFSHRYISLQYGLIVHAPYGTAPGAIRPRTRMTADTCCSLLPPLSYATCSNVHVAAVSFRSTPLYTQPGRAQVQAHVSLVPHRARRAIDRPSTARARGTGRVAPSPSLGIPEYRRENVSFSCGAGGDGPAFAWPSTHGKRSSSKRACPVFSHFRRRAFEVRNTQMLCDYSTAPCLSNSPRQSTVKLTRGGLLKTRWVT